MSKFSWLRNYAFLKKCIGISEESNDSEGCEIVVEEAYEPTL